MSALTSRPMPSLALRAVATAFLRKRPLVVAPMFAIVACTLAVCDGPRAQVVALTAGATIAMVLFTREAWIGRRNVLGPTQLLVSLVVTVVGIGVASALTGGLASPIVFMEFAPVAIGFAAFGRGRASDLLLVSALLVLVALALLPTGVPFPPLGDGPRRVLVVVCAFDAFVLLRLGVAALTDTHAATVDAAAGAGDDVVASARARTLALDAIGAKVAHEVKNPLSAIRGLVEVMAEKTVDGRDRQRLDVMLGEVDRIDEIVRGYLALARPLDHLAPASCDLGQLVREVAAIVEGRAARAGVRLSVDGDGARAEVDARRVKEALLNLILNAIDATPEGGWIRLRSTPTAEGAVLSVEDSGSGMDAARLASAGEPFASGREGGTGLGLAIARQTVEQHGGRLELDSAVGRGTVARLHLPAHAAVGAA